MGGPFPPKASDVITENTFRLLSVRRKIIFLFCRMVSAGVARTHALNAARNAKMVSLDWKSVTISVARAANVMSGGQ